ncbi:hypothetical protein FA95DRAFT_1561427, partial [Auriscalpium vulgare]
MTLSGGMFLCVVAVAWAPVGVSTQASFGSSYAPAVLYSCQNSNYFTWFEKPEKLLKTSTPRNWQASRRLQRTDNCRAWHRRIAAVT